MNGNLRNVRSLAYSPHFKEIPNTLKEETFAGRNFRGFAVFSQIRESFFPRNFLKKSSSANILKKIHFCCYNNKLWHS